MGASRHVAERSESGEGRAQGSSGSEERPELVDATHYDWNRLERAVAALVDQQRTLLRENEELRTRLAARETEVERLAADLRSAVERRKNALERVDALIDELDRLDASLDDAMVDWAEGDAEGAP